MQHDYWGAQRRIDGLRLMGDNAARYTERAYLRAFSEDSAAWQKAGDVRHRVYNAIDARRKDAEAELYGRRVRDKFLPATWQLGKAYNDLAAEFARVEFLASTMNAAATLSKGAGQ